jgi:hypothetical protein
MRPAYRALIEAVKRDNTGPLTSAGVLGAAGGIGGATIGARVGEDRAPYIKQKVKIPKWLNAKTRTGKEYLVGRATKAQAKITRKFGTKGAIIGGVAGAAGLGIAGYGLGKAIQHRKTK